MAVLRPAGDFDRSYAQDMALLRRPWHYWLLGVSDKIATPDAVAGNLPMDGDRAPERWWMA